MRIPGNFCLWNPESWALESRIQPKESGNARPWKPESGIGNPQRGIQDTRLTWGEKLVQ